MSKTIRNENKVWKYKKNPETGEWEEKIYDSDHNQYIPQRKLDKRFQKRGIYYKGLEYNGHSPQKGSKQRLNQELRAKEKEEIRQEIENTLNDIEN
jgi:hypothetical protein